jgi:hypothetical protein
MEALMPAGLLAGLGAAGAGTGLMAGATLVGGLAQVSAAKNSAKAQQNAANADIALQKETRDMIMSRVEPFYNSGMLGQNALLYNLGLGAAPTIGGTVPQIETIAGTAGNMTAGGGGMAGTPATYRVNGQTFNTMAEAQAYANANRTGGTAYGGFQATPGYQFAFDQGTKAVNALAGARGGLNSGRTLQDLNTFGQGIANQEFNGYLNRLGGLSDQGLSAATLQGQVASNAAANIGNAYGNIGNAQAAGAVGVGNAISGGINNMIGLYQYQNSLKPQPVPYVGGK